MKRDPRLRPLSRDHHHALALARRATLAATDRNPGAPRDAWDEVVQKFDDELLPHFEIEERFLLPVAESKLSDDELEAIAAAAPVPRTRATP